METSKLKPILESLLFVNEQPIELSQLSEVFEMRKKEIDKALGELICDYNQRSSGICIVKVAGGYQMCSSPDSEAWVKKMYQERDKQKFSTASLETLAIVAYKQPITRVEIEAIRGVNVDSIVKKLSDLGLIKIAGRKDVVGQPFLYVTTRKFLEYFGINSIKDLPKLEKFVALAEKDKLSSDNGSSPKDEMSNNNINTTEPTNSPSGKDELSDSNKSDSNEIINEVKPDHSLSDENKLGSENIGTKKDRLLNENINEMEVEK